MHFLNGILSRLYKRTPRVVQKDLFVTSKDPLEDWLVMERLETNPDDANNESLLTQTWRFLAEQKNFEIGDDFFAYLGVLFEPQGSKKFEDWVNARRLESLR